MAPRKRRVEEEKKVDKLKPEAKAKAKPELSLRVTRSSARLALSHDSTVSADDFPQPVLPKAKKAKKALKKEEDDKPAKTIVIEHCKQCNSFKTRANQVKEGLEKGVSGITVLLNPDKPRRGCFEIREEGGETFISLLGLKRPFKAMKDLDMDDVISDIIDKIK